MAVTGLPVLSKFQRHTFAWALVPSYVATCEPVVSAVKVHSWLTTLVPVGAGFVISGQAAEPVEPPAPRPELTKRSSFAPADPLSVKPVLQVGEASVFVFELTRIVVKSA